MIKSSLKIKNLQIIRELTTRMDALLLFRDPYPHP